jgi:2-amino-4-hydroxy-6-hydroxymethyldihydropteridine diphosphokinase
MWKFNFMTLVFFGLGSNIGDRKENLNQAINYLQEFLSDLHVSSVIDTEPMYVKDQPVFLNQVVMGNTFLAPMDILEVTQRIESRIGRTKTFKNGPRVIDIDILYYGQEIVSYPNLLIPHPLIMERFFVLKPLCEISPNWLCPKEKITMEEALKRLESLQ